MKYLVKQTNRFKKSLRQVLKRGKDYSKIRAVVEMLAKGEVLPERYRDHALTGDLAGLRDCHIESDWVLFYEIRARQLILTLADTGTHSDLGI